MGRPRDSSRDAAILDAALRLLTEVGYDRLTIEEVAARAGVGKTTIYRRYPGKAELVAAAVDRRSVRTPPAIGPADGRREVLLATLRELARQIGEQEAGLIGATLAGMRHDPALAAEMRRIRRRDEAAMTAHLDPAAARLFVEIAPAVVVHRLLVLGEPCDTAFQEHLVDDVLLPLVQRVTAGSRP